MTVFPVSARLAQLLQSADARTRLRAWSAVLRDVEMPCQGVASVVTPDGERFDLNTKLLYHLLDAAEL